MRTLRTKRETTPEGFHDEVLSDHITRKREETQQVNDPRSLPATRVARVRPGEYARLVLFTVGCHHDVLGLPVPPHWSRVTGIGGRRPIAAPPRVHHQLSRRPEKISLRESRPEGDGALA